MAAPSVSKITAFHQDDVGDWVATLSCGHTSHVRHNPPFINAAWVMSEKERAQKLGSEISCGWCDQER